MEIQASKDNISHKIRKAKNGDLETVILDEVKNLHNKG